VSTADDIPLSLLDDPDRPMLPDETEAARDALAAHPDSPLAAHLRRALDGHRHLETSLREVYDAHRCSQCHGDGAVPTGAAPDVHGNESLRECPACGGNGDRVSELERALRDCAMEATAKVAEVDALLRFLARVVLDDGASDADAEAIARTVLRGEPITFEKQPDGRTAITTPWFARLLMEQAAELLRKRDGAYWNNLEMLCSSGNGPADFIVTVQGKSGLTPGQQRAEAVAERDEARQQAVGYSAALALITMNDHDPQCEHCAAVQGIAEDALGAPAKGGAT
jgi:hypothetical protein